MRNLLTGRGKTVVSAIIVNNYISEPHKDALIVNFLGVSETKFNCLFL